MTPLYPISQAELLLMLSLLFLAALAPMSLFAKTTPSLAPVGHQETMWIDGLRGIAAVIVALNHAPLVLINLEVVPKIFYLSDQVIPLAQIFGAVGVQLFFCITGFLFVSRTIGAESVNWTVFFEKRVRRVVPAYLVVAGLALIIAAWHSWPVDNIDREMLRNIPFVFGFGLFDLPEINGFDFAKLLGVTWTLAIEWRFYFLLPIVFLFSRKSLKLTIASIVIYAFLDVIITQASAWVFFISGALGSYVGSKRFTRGYRVVASIAAVLLVAVIFARWGDKPHYGLEQWIAVTLLFASLVIARPQFMTLRPLVALGSVSYSFYLLHAMVLFVVFGAYHRYIGDIGLLSVSSFTAISCGALALASIAATASFLLIESRFLVARAKSAAPSPTKVIED